MNITQTMGDSLALVANAYHDYWNAILQPHLTHPGFIIFLPVLAFAAVLWGKSPGFDSSLDPVASPRHPQLVELWLCSLTRRLCSWLFT